MPEYNWALNDKALFEKVFIARIIWCLIPAVKVRTRKPVPPAQILHRQTGFSLPQKSDELLFREPLLDVRPPSA